MTTLFIYIMAASSNPDNVECLVPYPIGDEELFFGPCKRLLRKELREQHLRASDDLRPKEDVFIAGLNGSNREQCRKIVWAGRITRLMTFEVAYKKLTAPKYQELRDREDSPLHVRPLYDNTGKFRGYEHCSFMHEKNDGWVRDLTRSNNTRVQREGKQLLCSEDRYQAFPRDCCFLLENIFFAQGTGIAITDDILGVLRKAQPKRKDIDKYAVFGYRTDRSADGRAGRWLEVTGESAEELMSLIKSNIPTLQGAPKTAGRRRLKSCNCR